MAQTARPRPRGSVLVAMVWMILLSILLFWLPAIGPAIAGFVGGRKARGVGPAILAALLPTVVFGGLLFAFATALTGVPVLGAIAGIGGLAIALAHTGPLLLGAIIGGAVG
jgi:hypothetical protein